MNFRLIYLGEKGGGDALMHVEQRTIFRQRNHISPHFTIMIFSILEQNLIISLELLLKNVFEFIC